MNATGAADQPNGDTPLPSPVAQCGAAAECGRLHIEDDQDDIWTATDRDSERWRIEGFAGRQRDKWYDGAPASHGLKRRRERGPFEIAADLALIQQEYDNRRDVDAHDLGLRVLMLIWPHLIDPKEFYARPKRNGTERDDRTKTQFWIGTILYLANKNIPADNSLYSLPLLSMRPRKKSEKTHQNITESKERSQGDTAEVIGMAVMQEYLSHSPRNMEAAWVAIAQLGTVGGFSTGGMQNVRKNYYRFRRLAHERGYADSRAFWREFENKPWPEDQVWLSDFPSENSN